jgi:drug/metabolite transporter (DMT)-like permease
MEVRTRKSSLMEGVAAGVLFGTAAIFIRFLQSLDSFSIVFWRLVIACLALATLSVVFSRSFQPKLVKENIKELFVLSIFIGLHFIFFTASVKDTTILNATVLVNTVPFFSMLISSFVFKLKPSRFALEGLAISFVGVCLIAFGETTAARTVSQSALSSLKGDLEAVLAALVLAFYLNYGRKVRSQMSILSIMLPIYAFTAAVVAILSVPTGNTVSLLPFLPATILPLIGLGLLPTAIAHTLYFSSLSNFKSFETATMALLEPIGATILGIAVFQEIPALVFALGAVLVLSGILFTIRNGS